jgi:XRE family transcriptional regulator, master regulator for biofilm formation
MIGDRIKSLRKQKGYSITELAVLAGVSKSYLSYIERNLQNNPSLQFLVKIASPLETSLDFLIGDDTEIGTKSDITNKLDDEWRTIIQKAIDDGMSKDDFREYREFIKFKNWKRNRAGLTD